MYELKDATCDLCRTVYRAINKKHYCPHCDAYFFICTSCHGPAVPCPRCGVSLQRKTPPLKNLKDDFGLIYSRRERWNLGGDRKGV